MSLRLMKEESIGIRARANRAASIEYSVGVLLGRMYTREALDIIFLCCRSTSKTRSERRL